MEHSNKIAARWIQNPLQCANEIDDFYGRYVEQHFAGGTAEELRSLMIECRVLQLAFVGAEKRQPMLTASVGVLCAFFDAVHDLPYEQARATFSPFLSELGTMKQMLLIDATLLDGNKPEPGPMHDSFLESLLYSTWNDVMTLGESSPKLSKLLADELGVPDTGCTHWLKFAEHREPWTPLLREYNRRLILSPLASLEPATAETEFYTASAPSAVELAFTVVEGVLDDCSDVLLQYHADETTAQQLRDCIIKAIPEFDPNDASLVFARLQREFVILTTGPEASTLKTEAIATVAKAQLPKIIVPTNGDVSRIVNLVASGMPVQTAAKKVAENSVHSWQTLKTMYYNWKRRTQK